MDYCIVHDHNYFLKASLWVASNTTQDLEDEAFEQSCIESSFNDLSSNHLILTYCCYVRH